MTTASEVLIDQIEQALVEDDGDALEAAFYRLYEIDPYHARRVAEILRPLDTVRGCV